MCKAVLICRRKCGYRRMQLDAFIRARKGLTRSFLEKFHDSLRMVEHDIVTAFDCMDDPGRVIFQTIVELSEWARELRHPDSHNKHPLLHLEMITLQPDSLKHRGQRMWGGFLIKPSTVLFVQSERRSGNGYTNNTFTLV